MSDTPKYWAIVPAAGSGTRMGADMPKQYLHIGGRTLLERTLERLLALPQLERILVVVHPFDEIWPTLPCSRHEKIETVNGGHERSVSVFNGLGALEGLAKPLDWVLVHDAARPCVMVENIQTMITDLEGHLVGGLLGVPVADTLKKLNEEYGVDGTVDRRGLWQAQTPQMFRYGLLKSTMKKAFEVEMTITDEASALEGYGYCPLMIEGRADNIKVTRPEDLKLAELILQQQEQSR